MITTGKKTICILASALALVSFSRAQAAAPSVEQALKLRPVQQGVEYDVPTAAEAAKCKISSRKIDGQVGWVVEDANGKILRMFVDTNGDNVVDQWRYYNEGLEVYRDIDTDHNGKVDQCRWYNTGGSRWGLDKNEDGEIDAWKSISAEEVSAEVVAAVANRDVNRFLRVALSNDDLKSLGLGAARSDELAEKISKLESGFKLFAARQKIIGPQATWAQFSANKPGVVPEGTEGSTKDLRVYENVLALVESNGKSGQLQVGTLVAVEDGWRVIDLPHDPSAEAQADASRSGYFFQAPAGRIGGSGAVGNDRLQKLLDDLAAFDKVAAGATSPEEQSDNIKKRATLLEKIIAEAKTPTERESWIHQLTDMISSAVMTGNCPDGADRLKTLAEKLERSDADRNISVYVKFRQLTAAYALSLQAPKADFAKIQTAWTETLEKFVADNPNAPDAAEAMLQLAIAKEFAAQDEEAIKWYSRILDSFANSAAAKKAAGAKTRLESEGKAVTISGKSLTNGQPLALSQFRGSVVAVYYWNSTSNSLKTDVLSLKDLSKKYGKSFVVLGVNVDANQADAQAFVTQNALRWPQIFEEGGMDSAPANQMGILTVPTIILVDQNGKVVNRSIQAEELENEVKRLLGK